MFGIEAACVCSTGNRRRKNQDNLFFGGEILPEENNGLEKVLFFSGKLGDPRCFGVFDGMGGEAYGEKAAYLAALTMQERIKGNTELPNTLVDICLRANERICEFEQEVKEGIVGATAVMLGIAGTAAYSVNIGDSRSFLYRDGSLLQLSVDHTDQELLNKYNIQNRKPRLMQHLGIEPAVMMIEPSVTKVAIQNDDLFLLCSDGLTDMVSEKEMEEILGRKKAVSATVATLLERAMRYGGRDNVTIILCRIIFSENLKRKEATLAMQKQLRTNY